MELLLLRPEVVLWRSRSGSDADPALVAGAVHADGVEHTAVHAHGEVGEGGEMGEDDEVYQGDEADESDDSASSSTSTGASLNVLDDEEFRQWLRDRGSPWAS